MEVSWDCGTPPVIIHFSIGVSSKQTIQLLGYSHDELETSICSPVVPINISRQGCVASILPMNRGIWKHEVEDSDNIVTSGSQERYHAHGKVSYCKMGKRMQTWQCKMNCPIQTAIYPLVNVYHNYGTSPIFSMSKSTTKNGGVQQVIGAPPVIIIQLSNDGWFSLTKNQPAIVGGSPMTSWKPSTSSQKSLSTIINHH